MTLAPFARDKEFWVLHTIGWLAIFVFVFVTAFSDAIELGTTLLGVLFYAVFNTIFCLLFAWLFLSQRWHKLPMGRQIVRIFYFSFPLGILFGFILAMVVYVFEIDTYGANPVLSSDLSPEDLFFITAGNNATIFTFLMIAWSILYIGVFHHKRATEAERSKMQMEKDLKEAQINLLTGQLKPHFLFNALNNIVFTIDENEDKAKDMLVSLSEILRYSLAANQQDKVTVKQELHVVSQYLALVELQFEDKLVCHFNIEPECQQGLIPPMILQLLVENAVKHGIDSNYREGRLALTGKIEGEKLVFEIVNDTIRSSAEICFDIGGGLGLKNIRKRLALLYGEKANFHIQQENQRVSASLRIPMERTL